MSKNTSHLIEKRVNTEFDQLREEAETVMSDSFSVDQIRNNITSRILPRIQNRTSSLMDMLLNYLTEQSEEFLDESNVSAEIKNAFYKLKLRKNLCRQEKMKVLRYRRDPRHMIGLIFAGLIVLTGILIIYNQFESNTISIEEVVMSTEIAVSDLDVSIKSKDAEVEDNNQTGNKFFSCVFISLISIALAGLTYYITFNLNFGWFGKIAKESIRKDVTEYILSAKETTRELLLSTGKEYEDRFIQFLTDQGIDPKNLCW